MIIKPTAGPNTGCNGVWANQKVASILVETGIDLVQIRVLWLSRAAQPEPSFRPHQASLILQQILADLECFSNHEGHYLPGTLRRGSKVSSCGADLILTPVLQGLGWHCRFISSGHVAAFVPLRKSTFILLALFSSAERAGWQARVTVI